MRKILESLKEKIDSQQAITILTKSRNYDGIQMVYVESDIAATYYKGKALILKPECILGYKVDRSIQQTEHQHDVVSDSFEEETFKKMEAHNLCASSELEVSDIPELPEIETAPLAVALSFGLDDSSPIVNILREIESDRLLCQDLESTVRDGWEDDLKNETSVYNNDKFLTFANRIKSLPKAEDPFGLLEEIECLIRKDKSCEVSYNLLLAILYDRANQPHRAFRLFHESVQDGAAVKMAQKLLPEDDFFDYVSMRICFNEGAISKQELPLLFCYTKMCAARKDGSILFSRLSSALDVYPNLPDSEKYALQGVLFYLALNSGIALTADDLSDVSGMLERLKREWRSLDSCTLDRQDEIARKIGHYMIDEKLEDDLKAFELVEATVIDDILSEKTDDALADGSEIIPDTLSIEGVEEEMLNETADASPDLPFVTVMPESSAIKEELTEKGNDVYSNELFMEIATLSTAEQTADEPAEKPEEASVTEKKTTYESSDVRSISKLLDGIGDAEDELPEGIRTNPIWNRKIEEYKELLNTNSVTLMETKVGELCGFLYVSQYRELEERLRFAWREKREKMVRMKDSAFSAYEMEAME